MKKILLLLLLFSIQEAKSQVGLEQWREHLPYAAAIAVTEGDNNIIYCATPFSIFYYDAKEDVISKITKISGLSEVNISTIAYDKQTHYLVIGYENGNIDLIYNGSIINISDIKRKAIIGSKRINKIIFRNKLTYLCCNFGIVVLNTQKREIKDTYIIGPNSSMIAVNDLDYDDSLFYAATSKGIYTANINSYILNYFATWKQDSTLNFPNAEYNCIAIHSSGLYVNMPNSQYGRDTTYIKTNNHWSIFTGINNIGVNQIKHFGDTLIFSQQYGFKYFYNNMSDNFTGWTYGNNESPQPRDVIFDKNGDLWIADDAESLVYSEREWWYKFYKPEGPLSNNCFSMTWNQGNLWVASGGRDGLLDPIYLKKGIYEFSDNKWNTFDNTNTNAFDTIYDCLKIAVNPNNPNDIFIGTFNGIIRMKNNSVVNLYNQSNSTLAPVYNWTSVLSVPGLTFDQDGNLWATNSSTAKGLSCMTPNGTWKSFLISSNSPKLGDVIIDDLGQKWINLPLGGGIIVFNDNNTINNIYDDMYKTLTTSTNQGNLPDGHVNCLAKDKEGDIWVGTDKGVCVFYSPELVFTNQDFDAKQIYIEGGIQYLLESERVTAIAIDGANRKWFGTRNAGVFLMSEDGSKQIYHFTQDNSPLLSNTISSIAIDENNGEVFFGTENGIISFGGTATEGTETQEKNIKVFPNPVKPQYEGKIAINGLVENADVKITDLSGNLVYKTKALGGQAIWDGRDFQGNKVATGIYMVFSTDITGKETISAKIAFIK